MSTTQPVLFYPSAAPDALASLRQALAATQSGHALPRAFYKDPQIFELDMRHFLLAHWHCVGHSSMVAKPGDFFTVELASESILITRDADGQIRALLNVCRHRGSRICDEAQGHKANGKFVCPYHGWTYDCSGQLLHARGMDESFRHAEHSLRQLALHVEEGMIFITLAREPLGLEHMRQVFAPAAQVYGWGRAKVAARKTYHIAANWKLVEENYQECYHCTPSHQEYSKRHTYSRPEALRQGPDQALRARRQALGLNLQEYDFYYTAAHTGQESADCIASAMVDGFQTGSADGKAVAPLMGAFRGKGYDGGFSFIDLGPSSNFVAYPDYTLLYRTVPQTVDRTEFELIWLVDQDAVEGVDYDLERLTWMWDFTSLEDKRIIEVNQLGVNSAVFTPGPYAPMESCAQLYIEWYLDAMRALVDAPAANGLAK